MNQAGLLREAKASPDSRTFKAVMTLLEFRLDIVTKQWIDCNDTVEATKLQGRAKELAELIKGLTRRPVKNVLFSDGQ